MMSPNHFLITRFFVRINEEAPAPSEEWLRGRLPIFEQFTLPSVRAQTSQEFRWLLFVDSDTPDWVREYLGRVLPENSTVVSIDGPCVHEPIAREVIARTTTSRVITSRVDSDDALHDDYIATVQAQLRDSEFSFLNFSDGFQYSRSRLLKYSHPSNAFISLIEPVAAPLRTVFIDWHDRVGLYGPVRQVRDKRLWVQVCHGSNVVNQERGIRANHRVWATEFPQIPLKAQSSCEYASDILVGSLRAGTAVIRNPRLLRRVFRPTARLG